MIYRSRRRFSPFPFFSLICIRFVGDELQRSGGRRSFRMHSSASLCLFSFFFCAHVDQLVLDGTGS